MSDGNGWAEYSRLVLKEIERLETARTEIADEISALRVEIAMLKVKAGMWGAVSGIGAAVGLLLVRLVFPH